jgi:hypothetical protein
MMRIFGELKKLKCPDLQKSRQTLPGKIK